MKALKNDSTTYTNQAISAIADCYTQKTEPSNSELMTLYSLIGKCICEQGEKAFVVYLAEILASKFPALKGFSPRNLRRMRDFYRTYKNSPILMEQALTLNWTQNSVILDLCQTPEQYEFYIGLASEGSLSKLALITAIEYDVMTLSAVEATKQIFEAVVASVSENNPDATVDTTYIVGAECRAFVTACEPPRQRHGLHMGNKQSPDALICNVFGNWAKDGNTEDWNCPSLLKAQLNLLRRFAKVSLRKILRHYCRSSASPPSRGQYDFGTHPQAIGFA